MKFDENMQQIELLIKRIETQQKQRDFEGLLKTINNNPILEGNAILKLNNLSKKVYLLARLGRKEEAIQNLKNIGDLSFFFDLKILEQVISVLIIFIENDVKNLSSLEINYLKEKMDDSSLPLDLTDIIFDFQDFLNGNIL